MDKLHELKNKSLIFASNQDKLEILKLLDKKSLFLNFSFLNINQTYLELDKSFLFYLQEKYNIKIDLANKLKKYLAYIDVNSNYESDKLNNLKQVKSNLLTDEIAIPIDLDNFKDKTIYRINDSIIPNFFTNEIIDINLIKKSNNSIDLFKSDNQLESVYSVFEQVVKKLESKIDINNIVILNTNSFDDFHLEKVFNDSGIPITINKPRKLNQYPQIIKLLRVLKKNGYLQSKEYLNTLLAKSYDSDIIKPVISLYNKYLDQDLEKHPDILYSLIDNLTIKNQKYIDTINVYPIDDFIYDEDKHYLVMNYIDGVIPKISRSSDYLNQTELLEISYPNESDFNKYYRKYYQNLLESIENLELFYPSFTDSETRISTLELKREIKVFDYRYIIKNKTYLDSLNQLEFSKTRYDFETYYLSNSNYDALYNDYHNLVDNYKHSFTTINKNNLESLLKKNNSITGYKLESYNLCQFQYLLGNLLKLEEFTTDVSQYLGNLSHKVLEEYTKDINLDYKQLIDDYEGFPEEILYKERVFKEAIKSEIEKLLPFIDDLHNNSLFKDIKPEIRFKFPFKHDNSFYISGIIDKVMIKETEVGVNYFALIDYKLSSSKDFDIEKFDKKLMLQLPMYMYAYQNLNENAKPMGFFYQSTSLGRYNEEPNAIKNNFQLKGLAINNQELIEEFNSEAFLLKGIRVTKNGLGKSKRLVEEAYLDEIFRTVELDIMKMINNLKKGSFKINPLPAYGRDLDSASCKYCSFSSICYNKNKKQEVE